MRYLGGKSRTSKYIATDINSIAMLEGINNYYEPFVGGGNVVKEINIENRYASDLNKYLIAFYNYICQDNFEDLPELTREQCTYIKHNKDKYPDWYVYHAGINYGYRGIWFEGYDFNTDVVSLNIRLRDESKFFKDVNFRIYRYNEIDIKEPSIIYCDDPYIGTAGYGAVDKLKVINNVRKTTFDFDKYYEWLLKVAEHNLVFISEYIMPADKFKCINSFVLDTTINSGLENDNKDNKIENLYVVRGGYLVDKYYPDDEDDDYDF